MLRITILYGSEKKGDKPFQDKEKEDSLEVLKEGMSSFEGENSEESESSWWKKKKITEFILNEGKSHGLEARLLSPLEGSLLLHSAGERPVTKIESRERRRVKTS